MFKRLSSSCLPWTLVLLLGDAEKGYALSHTQVKAMVTGLSYNSTQYIVHERDATIGVHFVNFNSLFLRFLV